MILAREIPMDIPDIPEPTGTDEEEWYAFLRNEILKAEHDVVNDMGDESWECGGWAEVSRTIIEFSNAPEQVKREALRMEGLEPRLSYLGERPGTLDMEW